MPLKITLTFAIFLLTLAFLSGCAREPKNPTWNSATGAEQYERLLWQAIKAQQWRDVQIRLAPMFVGVGADGKKYDRAGWMDYWKSAPGHDFSVGDVTVNPAGTDMVVSYILNMSGNPPSGNASGTPQGNSGNSVATPPLRVVSVWQQVKSGWIMSTTSLTPVRE
jgi:hypothetical protein